MLGVCLAGRSDGGGLGEVVENEDSCLYIIEASICSIVFGEES